MKATEAKLLNFLKQSPQFVIPIYQRTYSWTAAECMQLWNDIMRAGSSGEIAAHFIGSIVYIEKGLYHVSSQSPLLVIDGQQRLTTASLILEALARTLEDGAEPVEGFSARKIRNYYLQNPLEDGEGAYKLLLTQTDRETLKALVYQKDMPQDSSMRIAENFAMFTKLVGNLGEDLLPLCKGLAKLMVVDISLSRDQDNPQLIFESMNSTGKELSQADLIRNYVLMGLEPKHQQDLYSDHWRPMELAFGQEAYGDYFDGFMRHYLTLKTDSIPKIKEVYDAFKGYAAQSELAPSGVDSLVAELHKVAGYYCAMALGKEVHPLLAKAFKDLRELKVDVAYPLLLELYDDYASGILSPEDFEEAVHMVESYVFRRAVCAIPTNSLNKTFATFSRSLKKDRYLESIRAIFLLMPSYRRFPRDEEFKRELAKRDLYNFRSRTYWLRRMENFGRKERVPVDQYTIEHIMPQNEELSPEWRSELGDDWESVQERWLHTLGNLTLTGYNSEYSDKPFHEKRDMKGGFGDSPLKLNEGLRQVERWTEAEIIKRAEKLSGEAVEIWPAPKIGQEILDAYRPQKERTYEYSIEDHLHLAENSPMRPLFDELRRRILDIDPCVTEEFLKLYVAYKAETNFVDVVPQRGKLRLSLNMPFYELNDPRGMARDVTNLGRWGNGDVEVALDRPEDLAYVMGLIQQSYERQIGNGAG
jgi:uncharacterized protein with ParB-like and HNH nuclease domain/predicted transport protein